MSSFGQWHPRWMTDLIMWLTLVNDIRDGWSSLDIVLATTKSIQGGWPG
jgi:hypothetical protein